MSKHSSSSNQRMLPPLPGTGGVAASAGHLGLLLALMVGFYLLAVGAAFLLLLFPYWEWTVMHVIQYQLVLSCLLGAGAILISILPRPDKFKAPGPLLTPADQPALFALLTELGQATGQQLPAKVYLISEVNAWVAQRGGVLGLGSKRIMGIGLPLLQILTQDELRAVLAHEFGHYYGGDTRLGPIIYQASQAMLRSVRALSAQYGLHVLFIAYAELFLRRTHAISRRQEFIADQLAAQIAGPAATISGLRRIHGAAPVYKDYWRRVIAPVLSSTKAPPLAEGFRRFLNHPAVANNIDRHIEDALKTTLTDPYDTHPRLSERIVALQAIAPIAPPTADAPSAALLNNVRDLELRLLAIIFGAKQLGNFEPISWEEAGKMAYIPLWARELRRQSRSLKGITPRQMPELAQRLVEFGGELLPPTGRLGELGLGERQQLAATILGMGLAVALFLQGWQIEVLPGESPRALHGAERLNVFGVAEQLAQQQLDATEWVRRCEQWRIADIDFGTI